MLLKMYRKTTCLSLQGYVIILNGLPYLKLLSLKYLREITPAEITVVWIR